VRGLNEALERLLFRESDRDAFLAGDTARFGLSREDEDALATIEREQLLSAATMARAHVLERPHRGVGNVERVFAETLADWNGTREELAIAFTESEPFAAYVEHGFGGTGICLEEAFYRFATERSLGVPETRLRELALGLLRGLAATPEPTFTLPEIVRRAPRGFYVVLPAPPTLLAILDGKFVSGPVTPELAAVLTGAVPAHGAIAKELSRMGLMAEEPTHPG
jgi:hypothetical protein